jgi:glycosyltransferase involved in cell wall biosynthesis
MTDSETGAGTDQAFKAGGRVLFIVYYLPPMGSSGVQRPLKLIKYLPRFGWEPVVVAPEPGVYHTFDESLTQELNESGAEVHRVAGKTLFHSTGGQAMGLSSLPESARRVFRSVSSWFYLPDNKRGWIRPAISECNKIIEQGNIDIIFSTAPPYSNHLIAADLGKRYNIPVVMDFRDDWLGSHLLNLPTSMHRQKMAQLEKKTLQQASLITAINKTMLLSLKSRNEDYSCNGGRSYAGSIHDGAVHGTNDRVEGSFRAVDYPGEDVSDENDRSKKSDRKVMNHRESDAGSRTRYMVLPQGFDPADFPEIDPRPSRDACKKDPIRLTYNGIFYGAQKPDVFLAAVRALLDSGYIGENDIQLVFQGGLEKPVLQHISDLDLNRVTVNMGYIPHRESVKNLFESDLLWFTVGRQKNENQVTTGKLFEYIGTGKPILGLVPNGEAARILDAYGAGYRADPDSTEQVQQILSEILSKLRSKCIPPADPDFMRTFNRISIAGKLASRFDELKSHPAAGRSNPGG